MMNKNEGLICKFMRFNRHALQMLINGEFYVPSLKELNDPADSKVPIILENKKADEKARKEARNFIYDNAPEFTPGSKNMKGLARLHNATVDELATEIYRLRAEKELGVLSFCKIGALRNPKMWAHYADESRGLCLVFKKEGIVEDFKYKSPLAHKDVQYDLEEFKLTTNSTLNQLLNGVSGIDPDYASHKSKHWIDEDEYRVVFDFKKPFESNYYHLRFIQYDISNLVKIYCGERMGIKEKETLLKIKDTRKDSYDIIFDPDKVND